MEQLLESRMLVTFETTNRTGHVCGLRGQQDCIQPVYSVGGVEDAGRICHAYSVVAFSQGATLVLRVASCMFVCGVGFDNSHWDS
jgi:hypothetical protein